MIKSGGHFDVESKRTRLKEIEQLESLDGFWEDSGNASVIQKEKSLIQAVIESYDALEELFDEFDILFEYADNDDDEVSAVEALKLFQEIIKTLDQAQQKAFLSGDTDSNNAIVSINAGAGGTESCDWASMLHRMVTRFAMSKSFKTKVLDYQDGDSAGLKSVTFLVEGHFAFGLLKSESGIHRLVRISPFDSNARRHTSFASIFVSPEIDDKIEVEVNDKDLKIDVFRASGAGGQSVNTTDSAVRVTHLPSGIVVVCRTERSQLQNKQTALKILKSRLYEKAMQEKRQRDAQVEAGKKKIEWGSQVRSLYLTSLQNDQRS